VQRRRHLLAAWGLPLPFVASSGRLGAAAVAVLELALELADDVAAAVVVVAAVVAASFVRWPRAGSTVFVPGSALGRRMQHPPARWGRTPGPFFTFVTFPCCRRARWLWLSVSTVGSTASYVF
jgi:hypothetical protein